MKLYQPRDCPRVTPDGVIIKPFEATDLLATVQKLIEKSAAAKPSTPDYEKTVILKRKQVEEIKEQNEWKEAEEAPVPAKRTIEMSRADASAPAFGMDMDEPATSARAESAA